MSTFRQVRDKENPYVMINKHFIHDETISFKAKGILLYIFSRPDDWQIYETEIVKHAKDSRSSVRSGVAELLAAGYMFREKNREKGKFKGYDYEVYETPQIHRVRFSDTEKPTSEKPTSENRTILNNECTNNDLTNELNNGSSSNKGHSVGITDIISFWDINGFGHNNINAKQDLLKYLDDGFTSEAILKALVIASENNVCTLKYVKGILLKWENKGAKTLEQVEAVLAEFENGKNNAPSKKGDTKKDGGLNDAKDRYKNLW